MASSEDGSPRGGLDEDKEHYDDRQILTSPKDPHPCGRWHKYVKPRVGGHFQVKVPKLPARSSFLRSQQSFEDASESERSSSVCPTAVASSQRPQSSGGRRGRPPRVCDAAVRLNDTLGAKTAHQLAAAASQQVIPERGGLCIHRPPADGDSGEKDEFLTFARGLVLQTPDWTSPSALASVDRRWKEEVEAKFGGPTFRRSSSSLSASSSRRRGRKRKHILENDDEAWVNVASSPEKEDDESSKLSGAEQAVPVAAMAVPGATTTQTEVRAVKEFPSLEEDERMLEFLQSKHRGNRDVAKFSILSDLSMGRAVQARRYLRKRRKLEEMDSPLSDMFYPSESWRRRYERLCCTMLGDVRPRPGFNQYPYLFSARSGDKAHEALSELNGEKGFPACDNGLDSGDEPKQTWRSVLECAEDIVERASGLAPFKVKPRLRDLLTLLGKAHTLLRPEEVFGKRDTTVKRISQSMNSIVDLVVKARNHLAKLIDTVYDEKDEGVELDALQKSIDDIEQASSVIIEETKTLREIVNEASHWEKRLNHVLNPDHSDSSSLSESFDRNNILAAVELLAQDAKTLSLRPRSLVLLEKRIERAHILRDRIHRMKQSEMREKNDNKKLIASLVREANKVDLVFPELTMLNEVHEAAQEWTERAAIAVRSRISLTELEELVERGDTMPVNLSDLLDKLRSRVSQARGWVDRLKEILEISDSYDASSPMDEMEWLALIRSVLNGDNDERASDLQDLASEGSRIPVDITELQLLHIEIDARGWGMKARKLLEKRGKIDELREHLSRGAAIRDRISVGLEEREGWTLDSEVEMLSVVERADAWYKKYRPYLEFDNRRSDGRCRISLKLLRTIVTEGNEIKANLGSPSVKMNRILAQAETWFKEQEGLLTHFGIVVDEETSQASLMTSKEFPVKMDSVNAAVESASNLSVDLEEAMQLKEMAEKTHDWYARALVVAPKRSKRNARGKKKVNREKHSLQELLSLVEEASKLPIDIGDDIERLQMQLNDVQSWRLKAQSELRTITGAFNALRLERISYYGPADNFLSQNTSVDREEMAKGAEEEANNRSPGKVAKGTDSINVHRMIVNLVKSVQSIGIYTEEEKTTELLGVVSKWCVKAAVIIASPVQLFEKRYFKDLDNLIVDGEKLLTDSNGDQNIEEGQLDDSSLMSELRTSWLSLVQDDKVRLEKCRERRDEFLAWCEKTEAVLSATDKKIAIETLRDLASECSFYPRSSETVKKLQTLLQESNSWIEDIGSLLKSGQKITLDDAKDRVAKGEELNISCSEFRTLRNALRVARGWQLRVKRSKFDSGQAQIADIKSLIAEHSGFLVSLPDEIKKLKEALQGYCLCRRPYEGFMVGCDCCEEWFHGPCIGVSESQAERYDKYVCVRCVTAKVYKGCAESVAQVIRKWTNSKDLTKSRQIDGQRHQRKVREKRREVEKLKAEIESLKLELHEQEGSVEADTGTCAAGGGRLESIPTDVLVHEGIGLPSNATGALAVQPNLMNSPGIGFDRFDGSVAKVEKGESVALCASDSLKQSDGDSSNDTHDEHLGIDHVSDTKSPPKHGNETREKLIKAETTLENCIRRLEQLGQISKERKSREAREDAMNESLRRWCILVRESVIVPSTEEQAKLSRPCEDGSLSSPMDCAVIEATKLGIRHLPDVSLVINAFGCMSWGLRALFVLARKPRVDEVRSLVSQSEGVSFKLPETKCVRMLQSPLSRAALWQAKVVKALKAIPGEKKPYDIEMLTKLHIGAREIPYLMPEEYQLWNTIEDEGNRHCICGGPSDGRFMISCDGCERWFHGNCVKFDKMIGDGQPKWICPPCSMEAPGQPDGASARNTETTADKKIGGNESKDLEQIFEEDVSPHAPNPSDLWPPFGLLQTSEALGALGVSSPSDCESISATNAEVSEIQAVTHHHRQDIPSSTAGGVANEQPVVAQTVERERSFLAPRSSSSVLVTPMFSGENPSRSNGFAGLNVPGFNVNGHHLLPHQVAGGIGMNPSTQQSIPMPVRIRMGSAAPRPDGLYPNAQIHNTILPVNADGSEVPASMMTNMSLSINKR